MIKLFRHFRKNLLAEGKTTKYLKYAIGEIVLVVIGILIALQINTWNTQRIDHIEELSYLKGLQTDLINCNTELDRVIKKTEAVSHAAETLLAILKSKDFNYAQRALDSLFINSGGYTSFSAFEGVINDIMGSGNLDLIKDTQIRTYIATWKANLHILRGWESLGQNDSINYWDFLDDHIDFSNWDKRLAVVPPESKVALFSNLKLHNLISHKNGKSQILNDLYKKKRVEIDSMIQYINKQLRNGDKIKSPS